MRQLRERQQERGRDKGGRKGEADWNQNVILHGITELEANTPRNSKTCLWKGRKQDKDMICQLGHSLVILCQEALEDIHD